MGWFVLIETSDLAIIINEVLSEPVLNWRGFNVFGS